jgi:hypothetical protein
MSDPDNFIARWSRRKRDAAEAGKAAAPAADAAHGDDRAPVVGAPATQERSAGPAAPAQPAFDPATLPSIESITAETDISGFLAPGVPAELRRAALRRAWVADPAIRDFVGLVENSWDFNDPSSIGGFGAIESTADLARDVARIVGELVPEPEPSSSGALPQASEGIEQSDTGPPAPAASVAPEGGSEGSNADAQSARPAPPAADGEAGAENICAAPQQDSDVPEPVQVVARRRGHGRALPE